MPLLSRLAIMAMLMASSAQAGSSSLRRQLSEDKIAGYEPRTDVTDHARIDLDQALIEELVEDGTKDGFAGAKSVFTGGSYSKSYATLQLTNDDTTDAVVPKGTVITGKNEDGNEVKGLAYEELQTGTTTVSFQYVDGTCNVGGNPDPNFEGCLNETGTITIQGNGVGSTTSLSYQYDRDADNKNGRTIQRFSTKANTKMHKDENQLNPAYEDFLKFSNYYGVEFYADQFITAALDGGKTDFENGNADFSSFDYVARSEAVKKGSAYMAVAMYVIRELEDALDDCAAGDSKRNDDAVHALDEAVAFYTGSLEGTAGGTGEGVLMYALADKRAENFRTAGPGGDLASGKSKINYDIFQQFKGMQNKLLTKDCDGARSNKERIAQLMFVPLVQGTLRYAYIKDTEEFSDKQVVEGYAFAASVLPVVHACSSSDATAIYEQMSTAQENTDFTKVKQAFENNYGCMGISCEDVGGYWNDADSDYYPGAEPCGSSSSQGSSVNVGLAVGLSIGLFAALLLLTLYCRCRNKSSVEFKGSGNDGGQTA